jgi:hypothetical protein
MDTSILPENHYIQNGNRIFLHRFGLFFYITLQTHRNNIDLIIRSIAFIPLQKAEQSIKRMLTQSTASPQNISTLPSQFQKEIQNKVLPTAEDYMKLFEDKACNFVYGSTSDTLQKQEFTPQNALNTLSKLKRLIEEKEAGPYLRFKS